MVFRVCQVVYLQFCEISATRRSRVADIMQNCRYSTRRTRKTMYICNLYHTFASISHFVYLRLMSTIHRHIAFFLASVWNSSFIKIVVSSKLCQMTANNQCDYMETVSGLHKRNPAWTNSMLVGLCFSYTPP